MVVTISDPDSGRAADNGRLSFEQNLVDAHCDHMRPEGIGEVQILHKRWFGRDRHRRIKLHG